jgi:hypothetical protein
MIPKEKKMRKPLLIAIGCMSFMVSACTSPNYGLESTTKDNFSLLPGVIELDFNVHVDSRQDQKLMTYEIVNGELSLRTTKTCPWPETSACYFSESKQYIHFPENTRHDKTSAVTLKELPEMKGYQYIGPFAISPDTSIGLLSITPESYKWPTEYPLDIVLIEMRGKKAIFKTKQNNLQYQVKDVAWSPDSKMFGVLSEFSERYYGPSGIIGNLLGHPVHKHTYYLSIYDRKGNLLVQSTVARGLLTNWGNIRFSSWRST